MFSKSNKAPAALAVYYPPAVYTPGSIIEGEVELNFRQIREDDIDEVHVKLRGISYTYVTHVRAEPVPYTDLASPRRCINQDKVTLEEKVSLAHDTISLWSRGGAYPSPGTDIMRIPFRFKLPSEQLPPSFKFQSSWQWAHVKYSVTAVGARKGRLTANRRHRVPFAVLPHDEVGTALRLENATHGWKRFENQDSIRKGLWGDYSKVHVEVRPCSVSSGSDIAPSPYPVSIHLARFSLTDCICIPMTVGTGIPRATAGTTMKRIKCLTSALLRWNINIIQLAAVWPTLMWERIALYPPYIDRDCIIA